MDVIKIRKAWIHFKTGKFLALDQALEETIGHLILGLEEVDLTWGSEIKTSEFNLENILLHQSLPLFIHPLQSV
jgi:hypothetical protein